MTMLMNCSGDAVHGGRPWRGKKVLKRTGYDVVGTIPYLWRRRLDMVIFRYL